MSILRTQKHTEEFSNRTETIRRWSKNEISNQLTHFLQTVAVVWSEGGKCTLKVPEMVVFNAIIC